jgi:uncharacterized protein (DUF1697 family)
MVTYISFLRGVNMTGHNSMRMTDLASLFSNLGYISPETYIQSGNVIFGCDHDNDPSQTASRIEQAISENFGYTVPAMIRSVAEMQNIMTENPYLDEPGFDPAKTAVIFLHENPSADQIDRVSGVDYAPDKFSVFGKEIYTFCPNGFGRTKIYTNFFENRMKVTGTARNWRTITTILQLAEKR